MECDLCYVSLWLCRPSLCSLRGRTSWTAGLLGKVEALTPSHASHEGPEELFRVPLEDKALSLVEGAVPAHVEGILTSSSKGRGRDASIVWIPSSSIVDLTLVVICKTILGPLQDYTPIRAPYGLKERKRTIEGLVRLRMRVLVRVDG